MFGRISVVAALAVGACTATVGTSASAGEGGFACWSDAPATCDYRNGVAHLVQPGDGSDGSGAGLIQHGKRTWNRPLARVDYGFNYNGQLNGGSPRVDIFVDANGDRAWDFYLTVDPLNCGGSNGVDGWASTRNPSCQIYKSDGGWWPNWDAVLADPATAGWMTANRQPFIVIDAQTDVRVWNVEFAVS